MVQGLPDVELLENGNGGVSPSDRIDLDIHVLECGGGEDGGEVVWCPLLAMGGEEVSAVGDGLLRLVDVLQDPDLHWSDVGQIESEGLAEDGREEPGDHLGVSYFTEASSPSPVQSGWLPCDTLRG